MDTKNSIWAAAYAVAFVAEAAKEVNGEKNATVAAEIADWAVQAYVDHLEQGHREWK